MKVSNTRGFTLLELLGVVAIIAVLAAIAFPSFQRYAFRARRAEGKDWLMDIASREERYFTNFNTYTTTLSTLNATALSKPNGYYNVVVTAGGLDATTCGAAGGTITTTYTLTATPVGGTAQAGDVCGPLLLDSSGVRCPLPTTMPANSNGPCW